MKIGFIGAGKVGCTLGRYLVMHGRYVTGYYDVDYTAAIEAAGFTDTKGYEDIKGIVDDSDILFITVIDSAIEDVWHIIKNLELRDKIICHCSGALSSKVFSDINQSHAYGYSVHPLFACSSKENSYKDISNAIFTIEGSNERIELVKSLIEGLGNKVQSLDAKNKSKYHCAAAIVSNQVVGIIKMGTDILVHCGFSEDDALEALTPLIKGNIDNIINQGTCNALTGPVERNDIATVQKHIDAIDEEDKEIYKAISRKLVMLAKKKNPDRDYRQMLEILL